MPVVDTIVFFVGGGVGGALCWHFKPFFQTFWRSAESKLKTLEADAAALQSKINAVKAVVK